MNKQRLSLIDLLLLFGIDFARAKRSLRGLPYYLRNRRLLKKQASASAEKFPFGKSFPCLGDRFDDNGSATGHYFHQDLLVARRIHVNKPDTHIDVGSRIDGFVAHVASFRTIDVIDIRPLASDIPNVRFLQADLMMPIRDELIGRCDSLSCLHAMEHFGLGRYGDPVNHEGYLLGLDNLYRILEPSGTLYFSVPIGPQRIEFDAHRVFSVSYLLALFADRYRIDRFSLVDDSGDLHENAELDDIAVQSNFGCNYGCGIFEMTKL